MPDILGKVMQQANLVGFDTSFFAGCLLAHRLCPEVILDAQYYDDVRNSPDPMLDGVAVFGQLAAISNDPSNAFEQVTGDINAKAAADFARRANTAAANAYVYAASCSVYGAAGADAKAEASDLNPLTAYARS